MSAWAWLAVAWLAIDLADRANRVRIESLRPSVLWSALGFLVLWFALIGVLLYQGGLR